MIVSFHVFWQEAKKGKMLPPLTVTSVKIGVFTMDICIEIKYLTNDTVYHVAVLYRHAESKIDIKIKIPQHQLFQHTPT